MHLRTNSNHFPIENYVFFLTEAGCVYCAVGNESLIVTQLKFTLQKIRQAHLRRKKTSAYEQKVSTIQAMYV